MELLLAVLTSLAAMGHAAVVGENCIVAPHADTESVLLSTCTGRTANAYSHVLQLPLPTTNLCTYGSGDAFYCFPASADAANVLYTLERVRVELLSATELGMPYVVAFIISSLVIVAAAFFLCVVAPIYAAVAAPDGDEVIELEDANPEVIELQ